MKKKLYLCMPNQLTRTINKIHTNMKRLLLIFCMLLASHWIMAGEEFTIGDYSFEITSPTEVALSEVNRSIKSAHLPATVTYKGNTYTLTEILEYALAHCYELDSVTIPATVTKISNHILMCSSPNSLVIEAGNPMFDSRDNCNAIIETRTNTLIEGCRSSTIPNGVTEIAGEAFYRCALLTSINIPASVTHIGEDAFRACYMLESIEVDAANTRYDSRDNCNAIIETQTNTLVVGCSGTVIPESVTSIGEYAYISNIEVASHKSEHSYFLDTLFVIHIPKSVKSIGEHAFSRCSGITHITISNSITSIELGAFYKCFGLKYITLPNYIKTIELSAFEWCESLTTICIPDGVESIGESAFAECHRLMSATIPQSVKTIGSWAFSSCFELNEITYLGTKEQWSQVTLLEDWDENSRIQVINCTDGKIKRQVPNKIDREYLYYMNPHNDY